MSSLESGTKLGPYVITGLLGVGGMGEVYRARDNRLDREVAIKVLPASLVTHSDRLRRFEDEAKATSRLNHPNILAIYDAGNHEGSPFVVSELLEGETLRERLNGEPLPRRRAIDVAVQVARGLAAAHDRGIVHRDLKPENIMITTDGVVKILDFGLAKLTQPDEGQAAVDSSSDKTDRSDVNEMVGTAAYMSPEQVLGDPVDHRSDIFAFGILLHEILSGFRPFSGETPLVTMTHILQIDPPPVVVSGELDDELDRIVARCLEKRPSDRFQSTRDLVFALAGLGTATITAHRPTWLRDAIQPSRSVSPLTATLGAGLLLAVVGLVVMVISFREDAAASFKLLTFRRGQVTAARFSPDGYSIVYSASWAGTPSEVFTSRLDGIHARPLGLERTRLVTTRPGEMAVLRLPWSGASEAGTLSRVGFDGGTPRELLEDVVDADWATGGDELAVARKVEGRCRLEWPFGRELYTSSGTIDGLRVSPDSSHLAFIDHPLVGDTQGAVTVLDREGNILIRSRMWADAEGLAWTPDGDELWFGASVAGTTREMYAMDLEGHERIVSRTAGRITLQDIAADGRVLVTHSHWRFEAMAHLPGDSRERSISWLDGTLLADLSDDGQLVLFTEGGEGGGADFSVWLRRIDGPAPIRLGNGQAMDLSPDEHWALALTAAPPHQVLLLPTGPGSTVKLPLGSLSKVQWAYWLPDGETIVVVGHEKDRPSRLWTQRVSDGQPQALTPEGTRTTAWINTVSPDGRLIPVVSTAGDSPFRLYPTSGGNPHNIPGIRVGDKPVGWSADGRQLYIRQPSASGTFEIARIELDSGRVEPWRVLGPVDRAGVSTRFSTVLLAADAEAYAYYFRRELSELYLIDGLR